MALVCPHGFPSCPDLSRWLCNTLPWPLGCHKTGHNGNTGEFSPNELGRLLAAALDQWDNAAFAKGLDPRTGRSAGVTSVQQRTSLKERYMEDAKASLRLVKESNAAGLPQRVGVPGCASSNRPTSYGSNGTGYFFAQGHAPQGMTSLGKSAICELLARLEETSGDSVECEAKALRAAKSCKAVRVLTRRRAKWPFRRQPI